LYSYYISVAKGICLSKGDICILGIYMFNGLYVNSDAMIRPC
jgi:hypothetical protein